MTDSIISGIVSYLEQCPLLGEGLIRVDCLGPDPVEYSVDVLPVNPVVQTYINGASIRQYLFAVSSRESYGLDLIENMNHSGFYEQLGEWFERQSAEKNFPDIGEGKKVQTIETVTSGYLLATDGKTARYQIQIRIVFFKEA